MKRWALDEEGVTRLTHDAVFSSQPDLQAALDKADGEIELVIVFGPTLKTATLDITKPEGVSLRLLVENLSGRDLGTRWKCLDPSTLN
jgi:hypothetical protein